MVLLRSQTGLLEHTDISHGVSLDALDFEQFYNPPDHEIDEAQYAFQSPWNFDLSHDSLSWVEAPYTSCQVELTDLEISREQNSDISHASWHTGNPHTLDADPNSLECWPSDKYLLASAFEGEPESVKSSGWDFVDDTKRYVPVPEPVPGLQSDLGNSHLFDTYDTRATSLCPPDLNWLERLDYGYSQPNNSPHNLFGQTGSDQYSNFMCEPVGMLSPNRSLTMPDQSCTVSPSSSESKSTTRKKQYSNKDWEAIKPCFERLYVDKNMRLEDVRAKLSIDYAFNASESMYKKRIARWGLKKNMKSAQKLQAVTGSTPDLPDSHRVCLGPDREFLRTARYIDEQVRSGKLPRQASQALKFKVFKETLKGCVTDFLYFSLTKTLPANSDYSLLEKLKISTETGHKALLDILRLNSSYHAERSSRKIKTIGITHRQESGARTGGTNRLTDKMVQVCVSLIENRPVSIQSGISSHFLEIAEIDTYLADFTSLLQMPAVGKSLLHLANFCDKYLLASDQNPLMFLSVLPYLSKAKWRSYPKARECLIVLLQQSTFADLTGFSSPRLKLDLQPGDESVIWNDLSRFAFSRRFPSPTLWFRIFFGQLRCMYQDPQFTNTWQARQKCIRHLRRGQRYLDDFRNMHGLDAILETDFAYEAAMACRYLEQYEVAVNQGNKAVRLAQESNFWRLLIDSLQELAMSHRQIEGHEYSAYECLSKALSTAFSHFGKKHPSTLLAFARLRDFDISIGHEFGLGDDKTNFESVSRYYDSVVDKVLVGSLESAQHRK